MEQQVIDLLARLEGAVTTLAPEAWALLVQAAYIQGVVYLTIGVLSLTTFLVGYVYPVTRYYLPIATGKIEADYTRRDFATGYILIGGFASAILLLFAALGLGDPMNWLAVIKPEAAALKALLS